MRVLLGGKTETSMSIDISREGQRPGTPNLLVPLAAFGAGVVAAVIVLLIFSSQNRPTFEARFWGEELTTQIQ